MNRFPMLSTAPKGMRKVPSPGTPSDVSTPGVRKSRTSVAPKAASTRMYGKADPQAPMADPGLFGGFDDLHRR